MDIAENFADALAFIYNRNDALIAKTSVTGYNRGRLFVREVDGLTAVKPGAGLHILVVHASGASEMSGTLRKTFQGICAISVYDELKRDVRTSVRRTLNTSAIISDMVTDSEVPAIDSPIPVTIENMSTSGVLIVSQDTRLPIGALLQMEFRTNGKTGIIYGEVVREQRPTDETYRYGCQLHFF